MPYPLTGARGSGLWAHLKAVRKCVCKARMGWAVLGRAVLGCAGLGLARLLFVPLYEYSLRGMMACPRDEYSSRGARLLCLFRLVFPYAGARCCARETKRDETLH